MSTHDCLGILDGHSGWIRDVQISGYTVVSGAGDHTAKLWDTSRLIPSNSVLIEQEDEEPLIRSYYGHNGGVTCLQFEGNILLTGSVDKTIRQWDLETGQTLSILRSETTRHSLDTDLDQAIYGQDRSDEYIDKDFRAWDDQSRVSNTSKVYNTGGHVGSIHFWQHALAAGFGDGAVRLFDLRTSECHRTLTGHTGTITSVLFDDTKLITGSIDKTVKVFIG